MLIEFNWQNLPPDMRLGSHQDEKVTLYRGFGPHQLDSARGMLSSAVASGSLDLVDDAVRAVERGDISALVAQISSHVVGLSRENGILTPFVSATPNRSIAERYARRTGEKLATLLVPVNRIVIAPLLSYEALILGSVDIQSIVEINE